MRSIVAAFTLVGLWFLLLVASPASAQTIVDGNALPASPAAVPLYSVDGRLLRAPVMVSIGARETAQLVAANTTSPPTPLIGGTYAFSQLCAGYGTLTLQQLGPDGATWLTVASFTAADNGAAHSYAFGSYSQVRAVVTGTTGCTATLARVPS